jgi:hypothetical protein
MNTRRTRVLAAAVMVLVAGCGGSSNKQLSYGDFIAKANAICRHAQAMASKATTPQESASAADPDLKKFKALKPPDVLKPAFDQFVSIAEQQEAALRKGDVKTAQALNSSDNAAASKMGTKDCISP